MPRTTLDIAAGVNGFLVANYLFDRPGFVLADDDSLLAHQVLDSLGVLNLITFLEQTYGIAVLENDVTPENLDSKKRIAEFVARKLAA